MYLLETADINPATCTWSQQAKLVPREEHWCYGLLSWFAHYRFGYSVAIDGDTIAVMPILGTSSSIELEAANLGEASASVATTS